MVAKLNGMHTVKLIIQLWSSFSGIYWPLFILRLLKEPQTSCKHTLAEIPTELRLHVEKTDRWRISEGMETSRGKHRHRKREWEIRGLVSHCNAHWQANSVDNVSVTGRSNHSVLSQNQSPRICTLPKCADVYSKRLKETYKGRMSRRANPVTFLPLSTAESKTWRRKCRVKRRGRSGKTRKSANRGDSGEKKISRKRQF